MQGTVAAIERSTEKNESKTIQYACTRREIFDTMWKDRAFSCFGLFSVKILTLDFSSTKICRDAHKAPGDSRQGLSVGPTEGGSWIRMQTG